MASFKRAKELPRFAAATPEMPTSHRTKHDRQSALGRIGRGRARHGERGERHRKNSFLPGHGCRDRAGAHCCGSDLLLGSRGRFPAGVLQFAFACSTVWTVLDFIKDPLGLNVSDPKLRVLIFSILAAQETAFAST